MKQSSFDQSELNLRGILESIKKIQEFTAALSSSDEFYADVRTFDAVLMNFVVIGELANRLDEAVRLQHVSIWNKVRDFRNIIAHNYFGVDAEEVWQIV
ncbi:MAG: DUF86 domain-containing protein [Cytophagaceae bacterium]|nr:DUF86 domain-containing protein [Cytophagaceae bacterium]